MNVDVSDTAQWEKTFYRTKIKRKLMPIKSENIIGHNMNLNLDNIRSHAFKLVQITVELSQNSHTRYKCKW